MKAVKAVLFDMDGVLVETRSSWVAVHNYFGVDNEYNLRRFWNHEIDEMEFVRSDVELWKKAKSDVTIEDIRDILSKVKLMPGADTTVRELRRKGIKTAIISGGIDLLANRVATELNMDACLANGLCSTNDGHLTGEGIVRVHIRDKSVAAANLLETMGIDRKECIAVGDSRTDIPLFRFCGRSAAFRPDTNEVAEEAGAVINELTDLLRVIENGG
ncbi:MAG: HAD-IB family phosphatase [Methanomassiliicoccales archaeon]